MPSKFATSRRSLLSSVAISIGVSTAGCSKSISRGPSLEHQADADISGGTDGWTSKMGGPRRNNTFKNGYSSDVQLTADIPLNDRIDERPIYDAEKVYVPVEKYSDSSNLATSKDLFTGIVSFDRTTGDEQWRFPYTKPYAYPTVAGETVFVQGQETYALNASDGSRYWKYSSGYGRARTSPLLVGNVLVIPSSSARAIVGLDARTGEKLWSTSLVRKYPTGLAADTEDVFVSVSATDSQTGELACLNAATGEFVWRSTIEMDVGTPVLGNSQVFLRTPTKLLSFTKATGERDWSLKTTIERPDRTTIGVVGGQCYIIANVKGDSRRVKAIDAKSGTDLWVGPKVPPFIGEELAVSQDTVFVPLDGEPSLAAIAAGDGSVKNTWPLQGAPSTGPAIDSQGIGITVDTGEPESLSLFS